MTDELLEFSISQYLDNDLSPEEIVALEERLKTDPAARALLDEYRQINVLLKAPPAMPQMSWNTLATHLSAAVAEDSEQFEFTLSQFADGNLPADEIPALEARLMEDPAARATLAQHQQLNDLLKSPAMLPTIRWGNSTKHLSNVIADASEPPSIKLYPNRWIRGLRGLALAACVLVASALGIRTFTSHRPSTIDQVVIVPKTNDPSTVAQLTPARVQIEIGGPDPETTHGMAVAEITIGAGPQAATEESPAFAEGIIARSPRSLIASNAASVQDGAQMPY